MVCAKNKLGMQLFFFFFCVCIENKCTRLRLCRACKEGAEEIIFQLMDTLKYKGHKISNSHVKSVACISTLLE